MNIKKRTDLPHKIGFAGAAMLMTLAIVGCERQPQSMFERQAETDAIKQQIDASGSQSAKVVSPPAAIDQASEADYQGEPAIAVKHQQAVAHAPGCDVNIKPLTCQYFELNIVAFAPKQPWLTSIMWQTIARVISPQAPLTSEDETAKNIVLMLLSQVEYGDKSAQDLPLYQRIDSEFVPQNNQTAYLSVLAHQRQSVNSLAHQYLNYVMLDMHNQVQLTLSDILQVDKRPDELLALFKTVQKKWYTDQGIHEAQQDSWPFYLSKQWYLDAQGLHMVYQPGELYHESKGAIDLTVPYELLTDLLKPRFLLNASQLKPAGTVTHQQDRPIPSDVTGNKDHKAIVQPDKLTQ